MIADEGGRALGGGEIGGGFGPELGQILSRGTKGPRAQVCHQCVLLKATGSVGEVNPQERAFLKRAEIYHRCLEMPCSHCWHYRKSSCKQGFKMLLSILKEIRLCFISAVKKTNLRFALVSLLPYLPFLF